MENKELMQNHPQRDIEVVTQEIINLTEEARATVLLYSAEIGRRLYEAKAILGHGEWGDWLKNEVHFSQRTAENHMRIFEAYGSPQISLFGAELKSKTFANLSYSAALKLLAVPDEEREDFINDNDIANKSVREIDALIKERDEAIAELERSRSSLDDITSQLEDARTAMTDSMKDLEKLTAERSQLSDELNSLMDKLEKSKASEKKAKDKLKQLMENPEIPEEKLAELRSQIEKETAEAHAAEVANQLKDIKAKYEAAEAAEIQARREAELAAGKVSELEKKLKISDPAVARFKVLFENLQNGIHDALDAIGDIKDEKTAAGFRKALTALAGQLGGA